MLSASWNASLNTPAALEELKVKLKKWNRDVFGDIKKKKENLMLEIKAVQDMLDVSQSDDLLRKEDESLKAFDVVLEQEELVWFQKSREKWINDGDRNTSFFHTSMIIRRRHNRIEKLQNDDDVWISSAQELENLTVNYFKRLYSLDDVPIEFHELPRFGFEKLNREEVVSLNKPFLEGEVEQAIRSMSRFKAPGPDGYQPLFYHDCRETVGESVVRFVLNFFETGNLPPETNDALVVLIAKVGKPEKITQFRPISLCNV